MEVTDGNDGVLAAGIARAATMQSFVCTHETSHVGTSMAHRVLIRSTQENVHLIILRRGGRREDIELVGLSNSTAAATHRAVVTRTTTDGFRRGHVPQ